MRHHSGYASVSYVIDPNPEGADIANLHYGVTGIPTDLVIDKHGVIAASDVCATQDQLTDSVNGALQQKC